MTFNYFTCFGLTRSEDKPFAFDCPTLEVLGNSSLENFEFLKLLRAAIK